MSNLSIKLYNGYQMMKFVIFLYVIIVSEVLVSLINFVLIYNDGGDCNVKKWHVPIRKM